MLSRHQIDLHRCVEAVCVLLSTSPAQTMSRKRLLALLRVANRKSLRETGDPIFEGCVGLVESDGIALWATDNHDSIQLLSDPCTDHLSDYDVTTLLGLAALTAEVADEDFISIEGGESDA